MSTIPPAQARACRPAGGLSLAARAPNWLGDAVLALPALRSLAHASMRGRLLILASSASCEVFRRVPGTLTVGIARPGGGALSSCRAMINGARILRSLKPVIALSFTLSFTSSAMLALGGVRRRIGFAGSSGGLLLTDRVPWRTGGEHLAETYCRLVESVGLRITDRVPALEPTDEDLARGRALLRERGIGDGRCVCFFPGARYGPSKRWAAERFALLGDAIVDRFGVNVVLLGSRGDAEACDSVRGAMTRPSTDLCGSCDFSALVGILGEAAGVVANDSGGMHLAAAVGAPVVGLFLSTDPGWTGPLGAKATALRSGIECAPCFRRTCDRGVECTRSLAVEQVLEALTGVVEVSH